MIRFLTLGTTELRADRGSRVDRALLSQPKRLALLAYLTVARPGGRVFRDTLTALLWPEFDAKRARHALRQTLYHLRRELGPDVVLGEDHAGVGINERKLWCDAVAFQDGVERDRHAHALSLYAGEFMPGFHSECGSAYDLWLDTIRHRLERDALAAAWQLTDEAEARGDLRAACARARRIVELQPYSERGSRRLALLLSVSGQRVEAIQILRALAGRLEEEGLAPSAETLSVAAAVREGGLDARSGSFRGRPDVREASADRSLPVLAVLPFHAIAGTDTEAAFADGLTEMVITALVQAGVVSVLSRTSVEPYRSIERVLPAIAEELGADLVMEGTVAVQDGTVRITAQLLDAVPERHLWAESYGCELCEPLTLQSKLATAISIAATGVLSRHRGVHSE